MSFSKKLVILVGCLLILFYSYKQKQSNIVLGDLVVVGDVHGCPSCLQTTLYVNGVVDVNGHWIAGNRTVVQLGDLIGRGPDDPGVINYVQQLEMEAEIAGGEWVQLIGNHEYMELNGDFRYGNDGPGSLFDIGSPEGSGFGSLKKRQRAFSEEGEVGKWLRQKRLVYKWGDIVMVHGGISSLEIAQIGIDEINSGFLRGDRRAVDHLLWDRNLSLKQESEVCDILDTILEELDATTMVVGHTITATIPNFKEGEIGSKCGGKLVLADVGMSSAFMHIPKYYRAVHF